VPTISWPSTAPSGAVAWLSLNRSVPQRPAKRRRRSISPGPGSGRGRDSIRTAPPSAQAATVIVVWIGKAAAVSMRGES
jgi:hypothetical protein